MVLRDLQAAATRYIQDNASAILTAGGVVGTVTTAVLAGRATAKASDLLYEEIAERVEKIQEANSQSDGDTIDLPVPELTKKEQFAIAAPAFIPPILVGAATIASIVGANYVSARRAAALAAAYGISQNRLEEYKAKVAEKLTGPKRQQIEDEIAADRVKANPPSKEVIIVAGGDVLCYDAFTGRYFHSTVEKVQQATGKINAELAQSQYASLSEFYDEIGLPRTTLSDTFGWSSMKTDLPFEVNLSTTMTDENRPCIVIDFSPVPVPDYAQSY
jgi:Family of unknown function (DUF6353)